MITCTEKCSYQEDGLCNLRKITSVSGKPIKYCPYFKEKHCPYFKEKDVKNRA